jgi:hypothetical protein
MSNPRIKILRLQYEIASVRDRVKDLEWLTDHADHGEMVDRDARTKAVDKLRHLNKELLRLEEQELCQNLSE